VNYYHETHSSPEPVLLLTRLCRGDWRGDVLSKNEGESNWDKCMQQCNFSKCFGEKSCWWL